ncbi:hypothetical protein QBC35DRAFT_224683 [Podospora australis]|uniref:Fucose-specific lectin n=1 Tax=Podospora australis TaxID=1536484 RepID=A0AAN6X6Z3_9PEZI|nr:hypothetical protein QBC35DRAFT_224683 [Podospora australis]
MASFLSSLLLLGAAVSPVQAGITAWWNGIAPQVVLQNSTTGQLRYTKCNSRDTPRYSYTDGSVFSLQNKPKNNTAIAGAGWWDSEKTVATLFYVDEKDQICNAFFECNMTTGLYTNRGSWIVSGSVPSISSNTGLSLVLLGEEGGYRIYYHDKDNKTAELGYTKSSDWEYKGIISEDISQPQAIGAMFNSKDNITVVTPRDDRHIAVTRWNKDQTWWRTPLPRAFEGTITTSLTNGSEIAINETAPLNFTLPAWDGKTKGLGMSVDEKSSRFIWYLGTDKKLYSIGNTNWFWSIRANQTADIWPEADEPNAELAVTYLQSSSMVRIYYMVKEKLTEIAYDGESQAWKKASAVALPAELPNETPTPPPSNSTETPAAPANPDTGLSTGAKAGIGIGVSLGVIAVGVLIAVLVLMKRKQKQQEFHHPPSQDPSENGSVTVAPSTPAMSYGSPAQTHQSIMTQQQQYDNYMWDQKNNMISPATYVQPGYGLHQLDNNERPTELAVPRPMYELPNEASSHELVADAPFRQQQQPAYEQTPTLPTQQYQPYDPHQQQQQYQQPPPQAQQRYEVP